MARTGIKNISSGPITLPLPLHGVLQPNKSVISSLTLAEADTLFNTANLAKQVRCKDLVDVGDVTTGLEGNVSMNSVRITDVADPSSAQDVATKAYVDSGGDVSAGEIDYTPTTGTDWVNPDPTTVAAALDAAAGRVKVLEDAGPASGMAYTPGQTADWPGTDPNDVAEGLDKLAARTDALHYTLEKAAADGAAADATAERVFAVMLRAGTVISAVYYPSDTLTADEAHNATLLLDKRDGAGGAPANIASATTNAAGTGSWAAFVGETLGALGNAAVVAGDVLTLEITKAGNGVVVPSGVLVVTVEPAAGA